jgi:hypothetical protein
MPFPTTLEFIIEAESQLGVQLPESFRAHLLASNGGEVDAEDDTWQVFPVFDKSDRKRIARTANHIVYETKQARSWTGFPSAAVAIAENGTGDKLVFLPSAQDAKRLGSAVLHWDHETGQTSVVAEDFGQL